MDAMTHGDNSLLVVEEYFDRSSVVVERPYWMNRKKKQKRAWKLVDDRRSIEKIMKVRQTCHGMQMVRERASRLRWDGFKADELLDYIPLSTWGKCYTVPNLRQARPYEPARRTNSVSFRPLYGGVCGTVNDASCRCDWLEKHKAGVYKARRL